VRRQTWSGIVFVGLLVSGPLAAEPLSDLRTRLAAMRSDQPVRMEMDVELKHRESAPLHLNKEKRSGRAVVDYGSRGVQMIEQRWLGSSTRISVWRKGKGETEMPLLDEGEAHDVADPVDMLDFLLKDAALVTDEAATWQEQPARFLLIDPLEANRKDEDAPAKGSDPKPFTLEAKIWLNDSGVPLAMERSMEIRLGAALSMTEHQTFTFQQVEGRLRAVRVDKTYSGTGLAVLHGQDDKKIKVTAVKDR
jgi:hypothetical protein